jgi:hypothetical protein
MLIQEESLVNHFNEMQIMRAYRQIYSHDGKMAFCEAIEEKVRGKLIAAGKPAEEVLTPKKK